MPKPESPFMQGQIDETRFTRPDAKPDVYPFDFVKNIVGGETVRQIQASDGATVTIRKGEELIDDDRVPCFFIDVEQAGKRRERYLLDRYGGCPLVPGKLPLTGIAPVPQRALSLEEAVSYQDVAANTIATFIQKSLP